MKLAIYGTLIDQINNNETVFLGHKDVDFKIIVDEARIPGTLFVYSDWLTPKFPIYTKEIIEKGSTVKVMVLELPDENIRAIDVYEGYPDLYDRTEVEYAEGQTAHIYLMPLMKAFNTARGRVISTGNWSDRFDNDLIIQYKIRTRK